MVKLVKYEMHVSNDKREWFEDMEASFSTGEKPKSDEQAIAQALETIEYFNESLRAGELPRKLIKVRRIDTVTTDIDVYRPVVPEFPTNKYSINENAELLVIDGKTYYDSIDISWDLQLERNRPDTYKEIEAGTYYARLAIHRLYMASKETQGKRYMACSPKLIENKESSKLETAYDFYYWLNYGDGTTYGSFTVEQVKNWLFNDDVLLIDMGGNDEYPKQTKAKREQIKQRNLNK